MTDAEMHIQEDTLAVLRQILLWELAPGRWDRLSEILDAAVAAEAAADFGTLSEAVIQLELAGPVRLTRIGATPTEPPPAVVRERVHHLIHRLTVGSSDDAAGSTEADL